MCKVVDAYMNKGKCEVLFEMVQEGNITLEIAASKLDLTIEDVISRMTESGYQVPAVC